MRNYFIPLNQTETGNYVLLMNSIRISLSKCYLNSYVHFTFKIEVLKANEP